jgi:hypothetical protein
VSEQPDSQPQGDLDPPSRATPAAVGASAPIHAPQRRPSRHAPGAFRRRDVWRQALDLVLDLADLAADRVAEATGVREVEKR